MEILVSVKQLRNYLNRIDSCHQIGCWDNINGGSTQWIN